jgi:hypothetical protein
VPEVRAASFSRFTFRSLVLDFANDVDAHFDQDIATPESKVRVQVVRAKEVWAFARECWKLQSPRLRQTGIQAMIRKESIADLLSINLHISMFDVNGFQISHDGFGIGAGHIKSRHWPARGLASTRDRCGQQFDKLCVAARR